MRRFAAVAYIAAIVCLAVPGEALAYIGPGAGISAIGTVVALFGAVLLAIVGFVWYPVKRLRAKFRKNANASTQKPKDAPPS